MSSSSAAAAAPHSYALDDALAACLEGPVRAWAAQFAPGARAEALLAAAVAAARAAAPADSVEAPTLTPDSLLSASRGRYRDAVGQPYAVCASTGRLVGWLAAGDKGGGGSGSAGAATGSLLRLYDSRRALTTCVAGGHPALAGGVLVVVRTWRLLREGDTTTAAVHIVYVSHPEPLLSLPALAAALSASASVAPPMLSGLGRPLSPPVPSHYHLAGEVVAVSDAVPMPAPAAAAGGGSSVVFVEVRVRGACPCCTRGAASSSLSSSSAPPATAYVMLTDARQQAAWRPLLRPGCAALFTHLSRSAFEATGQWRVGAAFFRAAAPLPTSAGGSKPWFEPTAWTAAAPQTSISAAAAAAADEPPAALLVRCAGGLGSRVLALPAAAALASTGAAAGQLLGRCGNASAAKHAAASSCSAASPVPPPPFEPLTYSGLLTQVTVTGGARSGAEPPPLPPLPLLRLELDGSPLMAVHASLPPPGGVATALLPPDCAPGCRVTVYHAAPVLLPPQSPSDDASDGRSGSRVWLAGLGATARTSVCLDALPDVDGAAADGLARRSERAGTASAPAPMPASTPPTAAPQAAPTHPFLTAVASRLSTLLAQQQHSSIRGISGDDIGAPWLRLTWAHHAAAGIAHALCGAVRCGALSLPALPQLPGTSAAAPAAATQPLPQLQRLALLLGLVGAPSGASSGAAVFGALLQQLAGLYHGGDSPVGAALSSVARTSCGYPLAPFFAAAGTLQAAAVPLPLPVPRPLAATFVHTPTSLWRAVTRLARSAHAAVDALLRDPARNPWASGVYLEDALAGATLARGATAAVSAAVAERCGPGVRIFVGGDWVHVAVDSTAPALAAPFGRAVLLAAVLPAAGAPPSAAASTAAGTVAPLPSPTARAFAALSQCALLVDGGKALPLANGAAQRQSAAAGAAGSLQLFHRFSLHIDLFRLPSPYTGGGGMGGAAGSGAGPAQVLPSSASPPLLSDTQRRPRRAASASTTPAAASRRSGGAAPGSGSGGGSGRKRRRGTSALPPGVAALLAAGERGRDAFVLSAASASVATTTSATSAPSAAGGSSLDSELASALAQQQAATTAPAAASSSSAPSRALPPQYRLPGWHAYPSAASAGRRARHLWRMRAFVVDADASAAAAPPPPAAPVVRVEPALSVRAVLSPVGSLLHTNWQRATVTAQPQAPPSAPAASTASPTFTLVGVVASVTADPKHAYFTTAPAAVPPRQAAPSATAAASSSASAAPAPAPAAAGGGSADAFSRCTGVGVRNVQLRLKLRHCDVSGGAAANPVYLHPLAAPALADAVDVFVVAHESPGVPLPHGLAPGAVVALGGALRVSTSPDAAKREMRVYVKVEPVRGGCVSVLAPPGADAATTAAALAGLRARQPVVDALLAPLLAAAAQQQSQQPTSEARLSLRPLPPPSLLPPVASIGGLLLTPAYDRASVRVRARVSQLATAAVYWQDAADAVLLVPSRPGTPVDALVLGRPMARWSPYGSGSGRGGRGGTPAGQPSSSSSAAAPAAGGGGGVRPVLRVDAKLILDDGTGEASGTASDTYPLRAVEAWGALAAAAAAAVADATSPWLLNVRLSRPQAEPYPLPGIDTGTASCRACCSGSGSDDGGSGYAGSCTCGALSGGAMTTGATALPSSAVAAATDIPPPLGLACRMLSLPPGRLAHWASAAAAHGRLEVRSGFGGASAAAPQPGAAIDGGGPTAEDRIRAAAATQTAAVAAAARHDAGWDIVVDAARESAAKRVATVATSARRATTAAVAFAAAGGSGGAAAGSAATRAVLHPLVEPQAADYDDGLLPGAATAAVGGDAPSAASSAEPPAPPPHASLLLPPRPPYVDLTAACTALYTELQRNVAALPHPRDAVVPRPDVAGSSDTGSGPPPPLLRVPAASWELLGRRVYRVGFEAASGAPGSLSGPGPRSEAFWRRSGAVAAWAAPLRLALLQWASTTAAGAAPATGSAGAAAIDIFLPVPPPAGAAPPTAASVLRPSPVVAHNDIEFTTQTMPRLELRLGAGVGVPSAQAQLEDDALLQAVEAEATAAVAVASAAAAAAPPAAGPPT